MFGEKKSFGGFDYGARRSWGARANWLSGNVVPKAHLSGTVRLTPLCPFPQSPAVRMKLTCTVYRLFNRSVDAVLKNDGLIRT